MRTFKCDSVPPDIDDSLVYEVPIGSSGKLTHCKGSRPWGYTRSPVNLKNSKMVQDFFLTVKGVTVARTLNALICQISVLTVSNFKRKIIKRYACCVEIKLYLYLAQDI